LTLTVIGGRSGGRGRGNPNTLNNVRQAGGPQVADVRILLGLILL